MNPHVRRLSSALALALPLVVTATGAAGLETSPSTAAGQEVGLDAVRLDPSAEHEEMSDPEHEESLEEEAEHEEMSDPEHEESLEEEAEHDETDGTSGDSHDDGTSTGSRPRALVLGSFGLVNAGVVVSAAFLRRRPPDHPKRRPATPAPAPTAP